MLISFAVTAKLICVFVFAYANRWFSHDAAHFVSFQDLLTTVFENGKLLKDYTFTEVRERAELDIVKKERAQLELEKNKKQKK